MNPLGIYFGTKVISLVETKGKSLFNSVQISNASISTTGTEDKVPEELKIVAIFKDELRKNRIEGNEATITLSGTDLIIRTFEIPVLPANELASAINFEAKKYIPFKIEELISSYQIQIDKTNRRYFVLFAGIKKETLEKYFSILKQLDIRINNLEYSAFSILRLIILSGINQKGTMGVISIDDKEEYEADFTVMENGFPLFSRDIKLASGQLELGVVPETANFIDKLKTEMRISLDYYNRKFPLKKIKQMAIIGNPESRPSIEPLLKEWELPFKFLEPAKIIGKPLTPNLSFLKAYSSSLSSAVKTNVKINIFSAWEKSKQVKELAIKPAELISLIFSDFKLDPKFVVIAGIICALAFGAGFLQKYPLQKELNSIIAKRPSVGALNAQAGYTELTQLDEQFKSKLSTMEDLLLRQDFLTPQLAELPKLIPEGMWLTALSFESSANKQTFSLSGTVYTQDGDGYSIVNNLLLSLKKDVVFNKHYKDIKINTLNSGEVGGKVITNFSVSGDSA